MLSGPRTKRFFGEWATRVGAFLTGPAGILSTVFSLLAIVGLGSIEIPKIWAIYAAIAALFALLILTAPKARYYPGDLTNRRLELKQLEGILREFKKIGVLGNSFTGKSTFVGAVSNIPHDDKQSERPYAVMVAMPHGPRTNYIALIDTVGKEYPSQVQAMSDADGLLIFVDNDPGSTSHDVESDRARSHFDISERNIVPSLRALEREFRFILVVLNKSDLWQHDEDAKNAMTALGERIVAEIRKVDIKVPVAVMRHSSLSAKDNAALVGKIGEMIL